MTLTRFLLALSALSAAALAYAIYSAYHSEDWIWVPVSAGAAAITTNSLFFAHIFRPRKD